MCPSSRQFLSEMPLTLTSNLQVDQTGTLRTTMTDKAQINRSLNTIRTELEYLRDAGVLAPPQFNSIAAQLPVSFRDQRRHAPVSASLRSVKSIAKGS